MIVPHANLDEAALVPDVDAIGIRHVGELIELMGGTANYTIPDMIRDVDANDDAMSVCPPPGDMNEVMGQETAKWALEVAAAGGHHLMMTGPPGTGKTMLASRIPGIMSPLSESEQLEVASIRSLCGTLPQLWHQRCSAIRSAAPYRIHRILGRRRRGIGSTRRDHAGASGHPIHGRGARILGTHPANLARTIGIRVCGDIPRERHHLLSGTIPTDHAANPCPCGYAYGNGERCTCREKDRIKYFSRLSGPILDRIDIQIEVPPVERINPGTVPSGESSHAIRLRVMVARQTAQERFREFGWVCNAQATGTWLRATRPQKPSSS